MNAVQTILVRNVLQSIVNDRALYAYAYISLMLYHIPTGKEWRIHKDRIETYMYSAEFTFGALPPMNVSSRASAIREKRRWKEQLMEMNVYIPSEIRMAKRRLIERFANELGGDIELT